MRPAKVVRYGIIVASTLTLLFCLIGIVLTGPISVRVRPLDLNLNVSAERIRADVFELTGPLAPRDVNHPDNLDKAAGWIAGEMRAAGIRVEVQTYTVDGRTYRNVIGVQQGSDPFRGALVVGAHYDSMDGVPGADDNASGVAALLELVRTLPYRFPKRNRYFVAFCTEEVPHFRSEDMGSYRFAERLRREGELVDLMIALDGIGYYRDEPATQRFPLPGMNLLYPNRGDFIAVVGDLTQGQSILRVRSGMQATRMIDVRSIRAPTDLMKADGSDHLSFRRLDMPGVWVTDTASLRNPHHHSTRDTSDTLDYERIASVVEALHGVLWENPRGPLPRRGKPAPKPTTPDPSS